MTAKEENTENAADAFRTFDTWIGADRANAAEGTRAYERETENDPRAVLSELGERLWYQANCERDGKELEELSSWILRERRKFSVAAALQAGNGLKASLRAFHGLRTANALAEAMLARKESRGPHFRKDFPEKRKELDGVKIVIAEKQGNISGREC